MTTEIICAIIGAGSAILSALIAFLVTRYTMSKEHEKLKMSWAREDAVASEDDFKLMAEAVTAYVHDSCETKQGIALARVAGIRATETRIFAEDLDALYANIRCQGTKTADDLLTKVIEHKQKIQRESDAPLRKKKKK